VRGVREREKVSCACDDACGGCGTTDNAPLQRYCVKVALALGARWDPSLLSRYRLESMPAEATETAAAMVEIQGSHANDRLNFFLD